MLCSEAYGATLLLRTKPYCSCTANQRKGVVADECGGAFESENNWVIRVGASGPELVRDPKDYSSGISTVGDKCGVVREEHEFTIDACSGERLRNHLLSLYEAVDAEVSPWKWQLLHVHLGCLEC